MTPHSSEADAYCGEPLHWFFVLLPNEPCIAFPALQAALTARYLLPVLAEAAGHYGISPVEMARASIVGQPVHLLSPLVPSTYLLVGLAKVEFGDHQRFTLK